MKFKELMDLPYEDNGSINEAFLAELLPNTPSSVIEQVYSDHGRNCDFQEQYAEINISAIDWSLKDIFASEISDCSYYHRFSHWFENVEKRAKLFDSKGWDCIDIRPKVRQYWKEHKTWMVPPILFSKQAFETGKDIHLVEGHTRCALLKGLITSEVIPHNSKHKVWVGSISN